MNPLPLLKRPDLLCLKVQGHHLNKMILSNLSCKRTRFFVLQALSQGMISPQSPDWLSVKGLSTF